MPPNEDRAGDLVVRKADRTDFPPVVSGLEFLGSYFFCWRFYGVAFVMLVASGIDQGVLLWVSEELEAWTVLNTGLFVFIKEYTD